jgi:O-acetyl-ADP-ribose deacetylase (regulator of RNase III)
LKVRNVIHTVGPVWSGGRKGEPELLAKAYMNSLRLALDLGLKTVSFPSISTGAYGFPVEEASRIALMAVVDFLRKNEGLSEVRFVLHTQKDLLVYEERLKALSF